MAESPSKDSTKQKFPNTIRNISLTNVNTRAAWGLAGLWGQPGVDDDIGNIDVEEVLWSSRSVSTTHHCDNKDFLLDALYTKLISLCFPVRSGFTY